MDLSPADVGVVAEADRSEATALIWLELVGIGATRLLRRPTGPRSGFTSPGIGRGTIAVSLRDAGVDPVAAATDLAEDGP